MGRDYIELNSGTFNAQSFHDVVLSLIFACIGIFEEIVLFVEALHSLCIVKDCVVPCVALWEYAALEMRVTLKELPVSIKLLHADDIPHVAIAILLEKLLLEKF